MNKLLPLIAVITSGICWYFSFGLSGEYWYLLWIAPIPVLLLSFHVPAKQSFLFAGIAYLIGRLSWLTYLLTVLPVPLAIFFTVLFPVIFALIVLVTRKIVLLKQNTWTAFTFPVLYSSFEFLFFKLSPDGTAGSIAYSEANFLPVVQVAAITGILGITFLVTLFPSAVSVLIYHRRNKKILVHSIAFFLLLLIPVLYGVIRMYRIPTAENTITAGLIVTDEKFHAETNHPKQEDELRLANLYADAITKLALQKAQVAVLPEKMVNIQYGDTLIKSILVHAAMKNNITVVAGYTAFRSDSTKMNMALVIAPNGNLLADYQKVNLFEGEAFNGFVPGKEIATFFLHNIPSGVAICKDMDYDNFISKYAEDNIQVLYVPAWDFIQDAWLHSRMAVVRGVENGYTVVRTARQGQLTISDYHGRILSEASCADNNAAALTASIPVYATKTIYSRFGDWFGYLNIIAAVYFVFTLFLQKSKKHFRA